MDWTVPGTDSHTEGRHCPEDGDASTSSAWRTPRGGRNTRGSPCCRPLALPRGSGGQRRRGPLKRPQQASPGLRSQVTAPPPQPERLPFKSRSPGPLFLLLFVRSLISRSPPFRAVFVIKILGWARKGPSRVPVGARKPTCQAGDGPAGVPRTRRDQQRRHHWELGPGRTPSRKLCVGPAPGARRAPPGCASGGEPR